MKSSLFKLLIPGIIAMLILSSCTTENGSKQKPERSTPEGGTAEATEAPWEDYNDDGYEISVYPKPVSITVDENENSDADASVVTPGDRSFDSVFAHFGFKTGDGGLPVEIAIDSALEEEEYRLVSSSASVKITAGSGRGVYNAVSTLRQLCKQDRIAAAEVEDKPAVPMRGVIEGFYGVAWTHEFRLDLLRTMGRYKMNAYVYAPKDDPKHRAQWRSLYTESELAVMKELVGCALENNVHFIYAISPGLDMDFGDKYGQDFEKLVKKCGSMYDIGVRDFAILLDDIPTYDAASHAKLLNDFQNKFVKTHEGCSDLVIITTEYCDAFITGYSREIAPLIQSDIKVMWTGEGVIPAKITDKTLTRAVNLYGRKLFIWWNYPVNDTMANNLFLGPCEGLGKNLGDAVNGLVSNPMNQGYASLLPLLTISDFLWNPADYDKEESLVAAAKKLAPDCAEGLYAFADLCRASVINGNRSSLLIADEVKSCLREREGALESLKPKLVKMKEDLDSLGGSDVEKMLGETKLWLGKAKLLVEAALKYVEFEEAAEENGKYERALEFASLCKKIAKSNALVSEDVLVPFIAFAKNKVNGIFGTVDAVADESGVSTNLPTYGDYVPGNAIDGDTSTFFWSNGAPGNGSTFTYDLGKVTEVAGVRLTMGASGHTDDYLRKGVIEYSADGSSYTKLCDVSARKTESSSPFTARYVRLRCTAAQTNWLIISEFEVIRDVKLPEGVTFSGNATTDISALFDGNLFAGVDSKKAGVSGKTVTVDASALTKAELFFIETGAVTVTVTDESGNEKKIETGNYTAIDLFGKQSLTIKFSGTFDLAEIKLSSLSS